LNWLEIDTIQANIIISAYDIIYAQRQYNRVSGRCHWSD